jgi:hypothetical protein
MKDHDLARRRTRVSRKASMLSRAVALPVCVCTWLACADSSTGPGPASPSTSPRPHATLAAAFRDAVQNDGLSTDRYAFRPSGGGFSAGNPANTARVVVDSTGTHVSAADGDWQVRLRVTSIRCGASRALPVAGEAGVIRPERSRPERVDVEHAVGSSTLGEWVQSGPMGIEQGFSLSANPCADDDLTIDVAVEGLALRTDGAAIALVDEGGHVCARYTDLAVEDASGRALPSQLVSRDGVIEIHLQAASAVWPVVVDPIVVTQAPDLLATGGAADDDFGSAVALSGTTALIGAIGRTVGGHAGQGAAYVFTYGGGAWTQQGGPLIAADGATDDYFGWSVALSGSIAVIGAFNKTVGANAAQGPRTSSPSAAAHGRSRDRRWSQQTVWREIDSAPRWRWTARPRSSERRTDPREVIPRRARCTCTSRPAASGASRVPS